MTTAQTAPRPTVTDALAAAVAVAKIEAERAYQATESTSERQRLAPLIACYRNALEGYHGGAGRGPYPTHTDEGIPLADVVDALYLAVPNYAVRSQKLADALAPARAFYYRPRFRFLPADANGNAVFTDCETGERVKHMAGPAAGLARAVWTPRTRQDAPTPDGYGVASMWESDVAEMFGR